MKTLMFSLTLMLISGFASAAVDVPQIQKMIKAQGAKWQAGSTWVSELPPARIKRLLGNRDVVNTKVDYSHVYSKGVTYAAVDWRNQGGVNWLGPVMNQGNCGSCVAFATVATFEAQYSIAAGTAWLKPQFSPQALFACGGGACENGWYTDSGAAYVKSKGLIDNACAPYTMGSDGKDVACKQFCSNQSERTTKGANTFKPSGMFGSNALKVMEALKKGPLVTSMTVYEDFLTYKGGIYKSVSTKSVGGHAVSIVGYNDAEKYWIIRNSWAEEWGEKGFARISWDDKSGIAGSTIGFELSQVSNIVTLETPAENDYISGDYLVKTQSVRAEDFSLRLMKNGQLIQTLHARPTRKGKAQTSLNTLGLEDGKYELQAVSDRDPSSKSLMRGFTISNHVPQMSISFEGVNVDLSQPVTGRPEFNVKVSSSPIMMQKIDFMATKLDGTFVTKRTTDVVLPSMKLGFRTLTIPNGEYYFFFRGTLPAAGKVYQVDSNKIKVTVKN